MDGVESWRGRRVGHFRVLDTLGEGGMGVVYRAEDVFLGRPVALKVIRPELVADDGITRRFLREARLAAAIAHPNLAIIHEVGRDGALLFIAMELIDGPGLLSIMEAGPMPIPAVCSVADDVASALAAIHAAGLVHRDVKPGNVRFDASGRAKLLDFGVAKSVGPATAPETKLTMPGQPIGSPSYMAPEQARGDAIDARADVFAFGVVLYGMLTGRHPFRRKTRNATTIAIASEAPPPVGDSERERLFGALLDECLAKAPHRRPTDGAALLERLRQVRVPRSVEALSRPTPAVAAEGDPTEADEPSEVETGASSGARLFGRAKELAAIEEAFTRARVVALVGPPGSGKTRLAREHERRRYSTSVRVGPLASGDALASALAVALELRSDDPATVGDALTARGTGLVVVDGAEALAARGDEVARITAASRVTSWLLTSAVPLPFAAITVPVGPLEPEAAAEMLRTRTAAAPEEGALALAVVRAWTELSEPLRAAVARLSLASRVDVEIARALLEREDVAPLLDELALRGVLEESEPSSWVIDRRLRSLVEAISDPAGALGAEEARQRLGALLLARADRHLELAPEDLSALVPELLSFARREPGVLGLRALAAAARLADRGAPVPALIEAIRAAPERAGVAPALRAELLFWRARHRDRDEPTAALADLDESLSLARLSRATSVAAHARYGRVVMLVHRGELDAAEREAQLAVEDAQRAGDDEALQYALNGLAAARLRLGRPEDAVSGLERACDIAVRRGDRRALARLKLTQGLVEADLGHLERALECYRGSRRASVATRQTMMIPVLLDNIGVTLHRLGELDDAERHLAQAAALAREEGSAQVYALALSHLGHLALERGDLARATRVHETAAPFFEAHTGPTFFASRALLERRLDRLDRAEAYAARARAEAASSPAVRRAVELWLSGAGDPLEPRPVDEEGDVAYRVVTAVRSARG